MVSRSQGIGCNNTLSSSKSAVLNRSCLENCRLSQKSARDGRMTFCQLLESRQEKKTDNSSLRSFFCCCFFYRANTEGLVKFNQTCLATGQRSNVNKRFRPNDWKDNDHQRNRQKKQHGRLVKAKAAGCWIRRRDTANRWSIRVSCVPTVYISLKKNQETTSDNC